VIGTGLHSFWQKRRSHNIVMGFVEWACRRCVKGNIYIYI
jgi:hypothetical protein